MFFNIVYCDFPEGGACVGADGQRDKHESWRVLVLKTNGKSILGLGSGSTQGIFPKTKNIKTQYEAFQSSEGRGAKWINDNLSFFCHMTSDVAVLWRMGCSGPGLVSDNQSGCIWFSSPVLLGGTNRYSMVRAGPLIVHSCFMRLADPLSFPGSAVPESSTGVDSRSLWKRHWKARRNTW